MGPNHADTCTGERWRYSGSGYNRVRVCACGAEDHEPGADPIRVAVERAVDQLFVNGFGDEADRLVLTTKYGRSLGGWCKSAVRDVILSALEARAEAEKEEAADDANVAEMRREYESYCRHGTKINDPCADCYREERHD